MENNFKVCHYSEDEFHCPKKFITATFKRATKKYHYGFNPFVIFICSLILILFTFITLQINCFSYTERAKAEIKQRIQ